MAKNIVIAVLAMAVAVLGAMVANTHSVDAGRAAGTIGLAAEQGGFAVDEMVVTARRSDARVELNAPKVVLADIGLLPREIALQRTAQTPERVRLDFEYQYYLSRCADPRFEFGDTENQCPEYVPTDQKVPGGARVTLDFKQARRLDAGETENIKLQFSTRDNDLLFSRAQLEDEARNAGYEIGGNNSTKLRFAWRAQ